ncbi:type II restriction/modification system DNA methylase subunit YeeA [Flavobacterium sp. 103]|uniref:class I SAM-dependent DNA methyltransferase n=1 Tax=Flavobacterium sp. 103 TaxID=2135624 RepID=UPI000D5FB7F9|nr:Eco57I restriction-modification methylase domain-containing protein [Flavobacterium sp. 103]PVX46756.1 type II restriction/modification system DNA methylase subunit YeeA [Flavobacterium sp. 103]
MNTILLEPRKALNKAFLKIKPNRNLIESFKTNLIQILDSINEKESEEFHKNLVIDFLKKTYYDPNYSVNTKGRNDLVIHNGKDAKTSVGVIIEAKSPINKTEMITVTNLNGKALQELVLYYLRERITHKNTELKQLVVTNIYEWFVFDAQLFNKIFAENKSFVKQFIDFEEGRLSGKTTDYFYKEIAKPFIDGIQSTIEFAYFDIRKYDKPLRNTNKEDDKSLVALFKLLSPEHLLKLSFVNDSNSLDKNFYSELLHLIGLDEVKEGGKKLIQRHKEGKRNSGSLLENAIDQLDSLDKISRLQNVKQYGDTHTERLFTVALELTITWVNRILFLKLLEAQLITYHKGDKSYAFLNSDLINDYDSLNTLFFQVLARKADERTDRVSIYSKVPYLNSSLFEPTDLEHQTLFISQLEDNVTLPLITNTVIKDNQGKKKTGVKNPLAYFLSFLDAYDFASEGSEDIQEENKTLINASVLGLIFEKINGYKDGSFFTPSFITMYMCKETLRRAVVQKFNETKNWEVSSFEELYEKISDRKEANDIINTLKICDPAVGSGHFLVSALNEIIAIKNDLRVLQDHDGQRLKEYQFEVVNDELMVTDEDGIPYQYNPKTKESQRIQETLFHEKQTIIENCLFGVDINPNSVKICRLRLWIELLKNAYYRPNTNELETLPNIDINIKCGNSLISRFALNADLKEALKKSKLSIDAYKKAVNTYRNADSKEQKREMEVLIGEIKTNFRSEINANDPKLIKLYKLKGDHLVLTSQTGLFELSKKEETERNKKVKAIIEDIRKLDTDIEDIKNNKIYENAFEWRFEFPDILNDSGDFVGFDAIIGNPPYVQLQKMGQDSGSLEKMNFETYAKTGDIYSLFYELGFNILSTKGILTFITSNKWMRAGYGESLRNYFVEKTNPILLIDFGGVQVFDSATVDTNILMGTKTKYEKKTYACLLNKDFKSDLLEDFVKNNSTPTYFKSNSWVILSPIEKNIKEKIEKIGTPLKDWDINIYRGILTGYNEAFIIDGKKRDELIKEDPKSVEIIRPILRGRDIKRYGYEFGDLWLINTHNGIKESGLKSIKIEDYPVIKQHLDKYYMDLEKRSDKGETPYNLRNCAYMEDFSKQKIVWGNLNLRASYTIAEPGMFINAPSPIIVPANKYLLATLNSKLADYYIRNLGVTRNGGYFEYKPMFIEKLPVPLLTENLQLQFISLTDAVINAIKQNKNTFQIEKEIDNLIYKLYELDEEEINFIEGLSV